MKSKKWKLIYEEGLYYILNNNGIKFPYDPSDGIQILEDERGYAYLDLNGNGRIDKFEDWHYSEEERYSEMALNLI